MVNSPERPIVRTPSSTGEVVQGLVWLSIASSLAAVVEVVYLPVQVFVPTGLALPVPWTIPFAALFQVVLSRTALLWSPRLFVAVIPLVVWAGVFSVVIISGAIPVPPGRAVVLFLAACAGGLWPLRGRRLQTDNVE